MSFYPESVRTLKPTGIDKYGSVRLLIAVEVGNRERPSRARRGLPVRNALQAHLVQRHENQSGGEHELGVK
jgi:hypothetical protein